MRECAGRGVGGGGGGRGGCVFFASDSEVLGVLFGVGLGSLLLKATTSSHIPKLALAGLLVEGFVRRGMGRCELNCFRGDQSHPAGSGPRRCRHYGGGQCLRGFISGATGRAVEEAPDDEDLNSQISPNARTFGCLHVPKARGAYIFSPFLAGPEPRKLFPTNCSAAVWKRLPLAPKQKASPTDRAYYHDAASMLRVIG